MQAAHSSGFAAAAAVRGVRLEEARTASVRIRGTPSSSVTRRVSTSAAEHSLDHISDKIPREMLDCARQCA